MDSYFQNSNNIYKYQTINQVSSTAYNTTAKDSFKDNYQKTTIDNNSCHNNIFNISNTYYNSGGNFLNSNKNISYNNNKNFSNDNYEEQLNDIYKLNFRIIESTTEDLEYPLKELKKG